METGIQARPRQESKGSPREQCHPRQSVGYMKQLHSRLGPESRLCRMWMPGTELDFNSVSKGETFKQ